MPSSTARVVTPEPAPAMRRLCWHFGHKLETHVEGRTGKITFEMGVVDIDATAPDELVLKANAEEYHQLERIENVVGSHLARYGAGSDLRVSWGA